MIRKKNRFQKPRKMYEKTRIEGENIIKEKYGLKNKKEIWKTIAKIRYFRHRAQALAKSSSEEQEVLFGKLREIGLDIKSTADVLALEIEKILERRLTSVVYKKKLANSMKHARQLVNHKKVIVGERAINVPSYLVPISLENSIRIRERNKKAPSVKETEAENAE